MVSSSATLGFHLHHFMNDGVYEHKIQLLHIIGWKKIIEVGYIEWKMTHFVFTYYFRYECSFHLKLPLVLGQSKVDDLPCVWNILSFVWIWLLSFPRQRASESNRVAIFQVSSIIITSLHLQSSPHLYEMIILFYF